MQINSESPNCSSQNSAMLTKEAIEGGIREIKQKFGDWASDIPLPHGVWTNGNQKIPRPG